MQIKRFDFSKGSRKKKNDEVKIDSVLDIGKIMCSSAENTRSSEYLLKGVVHHYG